MNADVRLLLSDGDRALRAGEHTVARAAFLEAGACAASYQLWRSAVRCYRRSLELDLVDREALARITSMPPRVITLNDWTDYAHAVERYNWPSFGCRSAQIVIGDAGAVVDCPGTGAVIELMMTADDLVEARPVTRLKGMPLAMAMLILRRVMWMSPRDIAPEPMSVRVAFDGRGQVRLDEVGDWEPVGTASPQHR